MNEKFIELNDLKNISTDTLIKMYKNGYTLKKLNEIKLNNLATCNITSVLQGTSRTVTITPIGGTPPYTVEFLVDGSPKPGYTFTNVTGVKSFSYMFGDTIGSHVYSSRVTDSCSGGNKIITDLNPCTINVTSASIDNYGCVNGICTPEAGTLPAGCNNSCSQPPPSVGCVNCDLTNNYCFMNTCIPKKYATYGAIGFGALFLLRMLK